MSDHIGIIGSAADKFDARTEALARAQIARLLLDWKTSYYGGVVSGGCHLGGVDKWAEEMANNLGMQQVIHLPKKRQWEGGYKQRNLLIAEDSKEVHVIVTATYPESYSGMRFPKCYHCGTSDHIKSGACWTAKQAEKIGKPAFWHIIK